MEKSSLNFAIETVEKSLLFSPSSIDCGKSRVRGSLGSHSKLLLLLFCEVLIEVCSPDKK
jgi:hypothetical protein